MLIILIVLAYFKCLLGLEFEYEMEEKNTGRGVTHVAKVR